jgi:hypothetical protein
MCAFYRLFSFSVEKKVAGIYDQKKKGKMVVFVVAVITGNTGSML